MFQNMLYSVSAQCIFIISSFLVHVFLGRILGPTDYGLFSVIMAILTIIHQFLIGARSGMSKLISSNRGKKRIIVRKSIIFQLILSTSLSLITYFSSSFIAFLLKDQSIVFYLKFVSILLPFMSLFPLLTGYLDGLLNFKISSIIVVLRAILKLVLVVIFVTLGYNVFGALLGYVLPSVLLVVIILLFFKPKIAGTNNFSYKKIISYFFSLSLFNMIITFLLNVNVLFVKAVIIDDVTTGLFSAASNLSMVAYMLFISLANVLLPSISSISRKGEFKKAKKAIKKSFQYLVWIGIIVVLIVNLFSQKAIILLYGGEYASASPILNLLIVGYVLFSLFYAISFASISLGEPKIPTIISIVLIPILFLSNFFLINIYGVNGVILSLILTGLLACLSIVLYLIKKIGIKKLLF